MKIDRMTALPAMMAVAVVTHPGTGLAADRTIGAGQTETSTQVLSGIGDRLFIDRKGTISTSGNGVDLSAYRQTLINRGTISANGTQAYALQSSAAGATVLNYGSITTAGICSYGTFSTADHFTFINNGTVATRGDAASYGIYVEGGNHATIVNNGLIDTTGDTADGINLTGSDAYIANHGALTIAGVDSTGIYVWHPADVDSRTVLVNTGTIRVTGTRTKDMFGQGIYANATGMSVINSGTISSRYEAVYMAQADQTLELLLGTRIEGGIRFDHADSATLRFGRGLDARLTLDGTPGTILTDGQAHVVDGDVLTVVSSDLAGAGATAAAMTSEAVAGAIRARIDRGRRALSEEAATPLAFGPQDTAPGFPNFQDGDSSGAWISAYGIGSRGNDSGLRAVQGGGLFGIDAQLSDDRLVGLYGGLGHGVVRVANGSEVETTTVLGGAYGSFGFGAAFVDLNAAIGATFNDTDRRVVNNTVAGGVETAHGDYAGFFFSPSMTVGLDHDLGGARLTPSLSVLYAGIHQGGYSESGSTGDLKLGSRTTHVLRARGEVEIGTLRLGAPAGGWTGSVRLGAEGTLVDGSATSASLSGKALPLAGSTENEARGFVGMEVGYTRAGYDFSARGEVGYDTGNNVSAGLQGSIGMRF